MSRRSGEEGEGEQGLGQGEQRGAESRLGGSRFPPGERGEAGGCRRRLAAEESGDGGQASRRWEAANHTITVICLQRTSPRPAALPANWMAPGPGPGGWGAGPVGGLELPAENWGAGWEAKQEGGGGLAASEVVAFQGQADSALPCELRALPVVWGCSGHSPGPFSVQSPRGGDSPPTPRSWGQDQRPQLL